MALLTCLLRHGSKTAFGKSFFLRFFVSIACFCIIPRMREPFASKWLLLVKALSLGSQTIVRLSYVEEITSFEWNVLVFDFMMLLKEVTEVGNWWGVGGGEAKRDYLLLLYSAKILNKYVPLWIKVL